ncbi:MAG TPA: FtsX-like permease family protein [Solirubrobacteraceae bacterium]|nr:FtsX-like permease family protein [Solirubrobacteraceae bacterium]
MSPSPQTRALTRLAWRELRHRPRRSLPALALVAVPVAALTVVAVLVATSTANHDGRRALLGSADAVVLLGESGDRPPDAVAADYLRRLPDASRVVAVREFGAPIPGVRGSETFVEVSDVPLNDPLTEGMTKLLHGRPPEDAGEVAASTNVLRDLGLRVGDRLVSRRLGLDARITAEVIDPTDVARTKVFTPRRLPPAPGAFSEIRLLLDLPPGTTASVVARLSEPDAVAIAAGDCCESVPGFVERSLARETILVISGIALLIMGLVVAAAFAIGARRQLRVLGLLSAAAGADERHVRRLSVLQGALCGGAGAIAGLVLGLATVAILHAPGIEAIANPVTGEVAVPLLDLALIAAMALAATAGGAWLPGATAARTPVLAALGGRRPLRRVTARTPVGGLTMSALGTVLMTLSLNSDSPWGLSLAGAALVVLGFVLCAPALVALLEPLAARARGTTRLAARDIARHRARTGPLVAAILAVASLVLLGSTIINAERGRTGDPNDHGIGRDQVVLRAPAGSDAAPTSLGARVRSLLPAAIDAHMGIESRENPDVAIGGPRLLEVLGAAAGGRDALARGEAVVLRPDRIVDGHAEIEVADARGRVNVPATAVGVDRPLRQLFAAVVISPQTAARIRLAPDATQIVFRTPEALSAQQRTALRDLAVTADRAPRAQAVGAITVAGTPRPVATASPQAAILAIAAALMLAVVAIGLALGAAEGKSDDVVLVALGADGSSRRRLRAAQAAILVAIGGLLALPAGLIPAAVIIRAGDDIEGNPLQFAIHWPTVAAVLVAMPLLAAAAAWILTRPARWSLPASWAE